MADLPGDFSGKTLKLNSPAGAGQLQISWPNSKEKEVYDARTKEFIETIVFVSQDFPDIFPGIKKYLDNYYEEKSFAAAEMLVEKYNRIVQSWVKINRGTQNYCYMCLRDCPRNLADHILKQVYRMSITDPASLNKYESFTSATYGETNFRQMAEVISELKWEKTDVFVDLGSGIGSIVMQAATCTPISRAIGIEIQEIPNKFAKDMERNFVFLMCWYGKKFAPIDLYDGSFLDKPEKWCNVKTLKHDADFDWRKDATVIFVNNYAFSEDLNLQLKKAFGEMNSGTKIVSTKEFCPVDFKINDRNAGSDIGSIMRVSELKSVEDGFSWTNNVVKVFLSVIDNTKLQEYYESKSIKNKVKNDRSSSSSPIMDQRKSRTVKASANLKKNAKIKTEYTEYESEELIQPKVNGKRGHRRKGIKIPAYSERVQQAFDRFHNDQIKAINNNPGTLVNEITDSEIDEAWKKATESCKRQFHEAVNFFKLKSDKFTLMYENEKKTIENLNRLVEEEQQKINQIKRKTESQFEKVIPRVTEQGNANVTRKEKQIAAEDAEIRKLQERILANQDLIHTKSENSRASKHEQNPQVRPSIIIRTTPYQNNVQSKRNDGPSGLPPRFTPMPVSPHSISNSPHSIKSSPSSENNKIDTHNNALLEAAQQSAYHISPRREQCEKRDNREHFPINLTPMRENSCESGQSQSSSTYGSPRSKRPRLPSVESNLSDGILKSNHTSVIQPTHHLSTSISNHITSQNTQLHQRIIRPNQVLVGPPINHQSVVRLAPNGTPMQKTHGTHPIYNGQSIDTYIHSGLHGFTTAQPAHLGGQTNVGAYLSSVKENDAKGGKASINSVQSVMPINGLPPMMPISADQQQFMYLQSPMFTAGFQPYHQKVHRFQTNPNRPQNANQTQIATTATTIKSKKDKSVR